MASPRLTLSPSRDIPFNKLKLSQSNVRRIKANVSIEELAEDIARRGLLQSLNVRPILDDERNETGRFEVPAGGRRFRALELLVRQKRFSKTGPVPCIVRDADTEILAEDDSLAENVCSAWRCIPSTNTEPSWRSRRRAKARRPSPPPSSCR